MKAAVQSLMTHDWLQNITYNWWIGTNFGVNKEDFVKRKVARSFLNLAIDPASNTYYITTL